MERRRVRTGRCGRPNANTESVAFGFAIADTDSDTKPVAITFGLAESFAFAQRAAYGVRF